MEAISAIRLHKQNFRRLVEDQGLVEGTGKFSIQARGRPGELFRFRHEVPHVLCTSPTRKIVATIDE